MAYCEPYHDAVVIDSEPSEVSLDPVRIGVFSREGIVANSEGSRVVAVKITDRGHGVGQFVYDHCSLVSKLALIAIAVIGWYFIDVLSTCPASVGGFVKAGSSRVYALARAVVG